MAHERILEHGSLWNENWEIYKSYLARNNVDDG